MKKIFMLIALAITFSFIPNLTVAEAVSPAQEKKILFVPLDNRPITDKETRQVAENMVATGMAENKKAARRGGNVARVAKEKYEEETGKSVVTDENYLPKNDKKKEIEKKKPRCV